MYQIVVLFEALFFMMIRKYFYFVLLIICIAEIQAAPAIIKGKNKSHAGQVLRFEFLTDYISMNTIVLASGLVNDSGEFFIEINTDRTIKIFCNTGYYKGSMFVVPGMKYEIVLPDYQPLSYGDKFNPYFQPTEYIIGIKNPTAEDPNTVLRPFHHSYNAYYNKLALQIKSKNDQQEVRRSLDELTYPYTTISDPFITNYVFYKSGILRMLAFQMQSRAISKNYFLNKPVLYDHPAYMELFNQTYNKYFYFFSRSEEGKLLEQDINEKKSFAALSITLKRDSVLKNDTLFELVVLKNLHDNFYDDIYSRKALLEILDSLAKQTTIIRHKEIARSIRDKVSRLMTGFAPPNFSLYDLKGELYSLERFKGKYVYLNFCVSTSYGCIKEFEILKELRQKISADTLELVTILTDENMEGMREFLNLRDYDWTFLHAGNQQNIMQLYDIRAYPTYYLIDRNGLLLTSPAPSPNENFLQLFGRILFMEKRDRPKN